jgi:hypothetical protein
VGGGVIVVGGGGVGVVPVDGMIGDVAVGVADGVAAGPPPTDPCPGPRSSRNSISPHAGKRARANENATNE